VKFEALLSAELVSVSVYTQYPFIPLAVMIAPSKQTPIAVLPSVTCAYACECADIFPESIGKRT
jgi:hypothetical protein